MSTKKHKGNHGQRAERRAAKAQQRELTASALGKPRKVYLRNSLYIWLTALCIVAAFALLIGFELLGLWDNIIGGVLSVIIGAFGCMCAYDIFLLLTASVAFGEGLVNAGKDSEGKPMIFHAAAVVRLEVRDRNGNTLPEGQKLYKKAYLCFVMASGRVNQREVTRLTEKQLCAVAEELGREQAAEAEQAQ